jgi:hypothetical protein
MIGVDFSKKRKGDLAPVLVKMTGTERVFISTEANRLGERNVEYVVREIIVDKGVFKGIGEPETMNGIDLQPYNGIVKLFNMS